MGKKINVPPGTVFRKWTVLDGIEPRGKKEYLQCKCECGKVSFVDKGALRAAKSSGCKKCSQIKFKIGSVLGEWTVVEKAEGINWIFENKEGERRTRNSAAQLPGGLPCFYSKQIQIGERFGIWTFLGITDKSRYLIKCDCGKTRVCSRAFLRKDRANTECICNRRQVLADEANALVGKSFGLLTVIGFVGFKKNTGRVFKLKCKCGEITEKHIDQLKRIKFCSMKCKYCVEYLRITCPAVKLNKEKAEMIRQLKKSGSYSRKDLSKMFKVTEESIKRVLSGDTWKER
jgi:hypothetical protein